MISLRLWFFEDNFIRDFTTEDTVIIISGSLTESGVAEQEFQTEDINADGMPGLDLEDLEGQHVSCWFKLKIASKLLHKIDIEINVFFLCKACSGISRSFIITCTNVAMKAIFYTPVLSEFFSIIVLLCLPSVNLNLMRACMLKITKHTCCSDATSPRQYPSVYLFRCQYPRQYPSVYLFRCQYPGQYLDSWRRDGVLDGDGRHWLCDGLRHRQRLSPVRHRVRIRR